MPDHVAQAQLCVDDNIRVERYDIDAIRREIPRWDQLRTADRRRVLEAVAPDGVSTTSNVTCEALHEYLAMVLTLEPGEGGQLDQPSELAFGDDRSSFSISDTELNNEVGRIKITDDSVTGSIFSVDEYVSSNELNGNTLSEIGIVSRQGDLYQHGPLSEDYDKDSSVALIVNVRLALTDA